MSPPNAIAAQPALNPTPWRFANRAGCVFIDDANGVHIVTFYGNDKFAERQAERICGAVNGRAELVAACEAGALELEVQSKQHSQSNWPISAAACDHAARILREAIARAQPHYGRTTIEPGAFGNVE